MSAIVGTASRLAHSAVGVLFEPRLLILIFHRVHPVPDPLFPGEPDARRFDSLLEMIKSSFRVLSLRAAVISVDGSGSVRLSASGPLDEAAEIGRRLANDLLAEGAADLMWERVP